MQIERLFVTAASYAATKHAGQVRKGKKPVPYINHPIEVARLLVEIGRVEDHQVVVAALLHDTLEDTDATESDIADKFSDAVAAMVQEVTDDTSLPRKLRVKEQVSSAPKKTPGAALIKVADQTANVHDVIHAPPLEWDDARRQEYIDKASSVVHAMAPIASGTWDAPGWDENQLAAMRRLYAHFLDIINESPFDVCQ